MKSRSDGPLTPGGVDGYIAQCPEGVQRTLEKVRAAIRAAAPGSSETTSYFDMPGYFYEGYDYNGMFAWFSYKKPHIRLHLRPPVIENHADELKGYAATKAIISVPANVGMPAALVRKLVKASIRAMKSPPVPRPPRAAGRRS
jgi:uncharacterized protein YdhG (YjbR/CyaY superfamily)